MEGFRWLTVAVRPHSVSRVAAQRAVLLQLFVVDVFFALEIRTFGSGGNPFSQRLDYLGVEAFRGLGDAADETCCGAGSFAAEGEGLHQTEGVELPALTVGENAWCRADIGVRFAG